MSRETDTSSSGPQGRGGAAPDEPKTETTLTTRIRINIPGSRPIPPVVVRKPVNEANAAEKKAAEEPKQQTRAQRHEQESPAERTGATPRPEPEEQPKPTATSDWFAPRKPATPTPPPESPSQGGDSGTGPAAGTGGGPGSGVGANATGYAATKPQPQGGPPPPGQQSTPAPGMPYFSDGPEAPSGPTTGPAYGTTQVPPVDPMDPMGGADPMGADYTAAHAMASDTMGIPQLSDDTAVLTPQNPAAHPRGPQAGPPPQVSGDTVTTGIPVVPQDASSPFPMSGPIRPAATEPRGYSDGYGAYPATLDEPAPERPTPPPAPRTRTPASAPVPKKKGRSKLVLVGASLFGVIGVAYGAGLLLNQADVPKGTTVLGVDIGGVTKEEAVQKLDAGLGQRASTPLQLTVGGKEQSLAPDKAGLALDSQATVRGAAGSDYNPVSVIGSLFGAERVAQPVIPVDEEKLSAALADLAGGSGSVTEGTIKFEPGKVTAVPGKSGTVLDVQRSMLYVRDAYRAQVETGRTNVVELPVATKEPTIGAAELDRAMKEFAKPAMSDLITIKAGGKQIQFGPQRSLPQILSMKPIDGRLVEVYDKKAIDRLLEGVFDGIMVTKGDGQKHQVSADDVASAMQKALLGKTPAERTVTIDLNPKG